MQSHLGIDVIKISGFEAAFGSGAVMAHAGALSKPVFHDD
jgi:hypothetical protein